MIKSKSHLSKRILKTYELYIFLLPAFIFYILFKYIPIYGLQIAFKDFSPVFGFWKSQWVGLVNFERFFNSTDWLDVIKNTLIINLYSLLFGFPIPILLALMLDKVINKYFKKTVQMVTYAPYFISSVVLVGMLYVLFSPSNGIVNILLKKMGVRSIFFMGESKLFVPMFVGSGIWQSAGWSSVIYIAALSGVSPELHESALIDGANKFQRAWYVDIPCILPTIITMFLLQLGHLFSVGFDKVYLMQNPLNLSTSEVISTFTYKRGILDGDFSFATAVGLMESSINFVLLTVFNRVAKKISGTGLW